MGNDRRALHRRIATEQTMTPEEFDVFYQEDTDSSVRMLGWAIIVATLVIVPAIALGMIWWLL
jgi:hypothetical protein